MLYYVYVYLDPRKKGNFTYGEYHFEYEPYYIGKGKDDRINDVKGRSVEYHSDKIIEEGHEPIKIIYCSELNELEAYQLEANMIEKIGRRYDGGPLTNSLKNQSEVARKRKSRTKKRDIANKKNSEAQDAMMNFLDSLK